MTKRASPPPPTATVAPPPPRRLLEPFHEFVAPGRRRSDHPLVVGTIVLCLGLITVGSVAQNLATFWAGSQVRLLIDENAKQAKDRVGRDEERKAMWSAVVRASEAQARTLQRVCLNVARSEDERRECITIPIQLPVQAPKESR